MPAKFRKCTLWTVQLMRAIYLYIFYIQIQVDWIILSKLSILLCYVFESVDLTKHMKKQQEFRQSACSMALKFAGQMTYTRLVKCGIHVP